MNLAETFTAAERFALSLDGLCRVVAARIAPGIAGWAMQAAMIVLVWTRIRRARLKIQALLVRFQSGRLLVRTSVAVRARAGGGRRERDAGAAAPSLERRLPRGFAWLLPMVPWEAASFAGHLRAVLAEPEMVALLEASAQARRVLAPVCRMLGIEAELLRAPVPLEVAPIGSDLAIAVVGAVPVPAEGARDGAEVQRRERPDRIRWGGD